MSAVTVDLEVLRGIVREIVSSVVSETIRPEKPKRAFYSPREIAQRFGIKDVQTVRDWISKGKIEASQDEYSGRWMIPQCEVEYLDSTNGKPCKRGTI